MRILLVVANFVPEIGSAAHIYYDLGKELVKRGHDVHVLTSYPRSFNTSAIPPKNSAAIFENDNGLSIHRCRHPSSQRNLPLRGIEHLLISFLYYIRFRGIKQKFEVAMLYLPPLSLYRLGRLLKRHGIPSILNVQDFHPQELLDVGLIKEGLIRDLLARDEHLAYSSADSVLVLTEGGIKFVTDRGAAPDRVHHVFNSTEVDVIRDVEDSRRFREHEGIGDRIMVTYGGIMSPFQGLDAVLDLARTLIDDGRFQFYLVGGGMMRSHLKERIKEESIRNVRLLEMQPRNVYNQIISASDICLVTLDRRMNAPCLPGKLINILAAGKAVVAAVPPRSETAKVVEQAGAGFVVSPDDTQGLRDAVLRLASDQRMREMMGQNGRRYAYENMNLERNAAKIEGLLEQLAEERSMSQGPTSNRRG